MAVPKTLARPYVRTAAALAKDSGRWVDWGQALEALGILGGNKAAVRFLAQPGPDAPVGAWVKSLLPGLLWEEPLELLLLLRAQKQLPLMREFPGLWQELEEERLGVKALEIRTPYPLDDQGTKTLTMALEKQFHCRLQPQVVVDPLLVGGYAARVGDRVLDASVQGALNRLKDDILWDREIENATQR